MPSTPATSRRDFLAAAGASALAATAGCTAVADAVTPLREHVHRADADLAGEATPWPTLGADARRTGAVDREAPPADANVFEVTSVGRYPRTQAVVAGDRAYVGVDRRTGEGDDDEFSGLAAVDLGDRTRDPVAWREPAGGPSGSFTPAVAGNTVFAPLGEGIHALDARDGSLLWRTTTGGGTPAVVGETCFTFGGKHSLVALDARTGETRWTTGDTDAAPSGFAVADDAVALATGDGGQGALYCHERSDGTRRWKYPLGESYAHAVTDGERVYAVGTDGYLDAVTLSGGERAWRHDFEGESYQRVAVADGTVFAAGTNDEVLVALDAGTGETRWRRSTGVGGPSTPAVTPESVLVVAATADGRQLLALDRADGSERARYPLPAGLFEEIQPVVGDGVAYVLAEPSDRVEGSLYAVR